MADKTMPPVSENLDAPATEAPMAPEAAAAPAPQDEGSVMVTIPKAAFDSMHQIIVQLASGLDELAKGVNQEAAAQAPAAPEAAAAPAAGAASDEEFLNSMAEEGSVR